MWAFLNKEFVSYKKTKTKILVSKAKMFCNLFNFGDRHTDPLPCSTQDLTEDVMDWGREGGGVMFF